MSTFTVLIAIGAIYQLYTAVTKKKGTQETPRKLPGSLKLPNGGFKRDVIPGTSGGTWREQLKQALENVANQAESLQSIKPKEIEGTKDSYVETKEIQGIEETQGVVGISKHEGILGPEAYKSTEDTAGEKMATNSSDLSSASLSLTERELVQGVMWAEVLGKPRGLRPFRGPRS